MFINKINGISKIGFKGYQHVKNDVGNTVMKFNYPYDSKNETCEVQIYKVSPTEKYNYKLDSTPIATIELSPEGTDVDLQEITNLGKDEPFAYQIVRRDKATGEIKWAGADTGVKMKNQNGEYVFRVHQDKAYKGVKEGDKELYAYQTNDYNNDSVENYKHTLVTRKGTTPMVQGTGYLVIPDSLKPGMKYYGFDSDKTGEIYYDKDHQKRMENTIRTFSNRFGGNLAGLEAAIPYLRQNGYKEMFSTPIANGDSVSSHSYWNKNNMQIADRMGNKENFNSFMRNMFANGMKYNYDGTFTSEGLEGIHFQYALRWANQKPQSYYWFRMSGLRNSSLGLGVIPRNRENLRHRIVNAPFNYELQPNGTYKAVENLNYDANKETYLQIYDASQVTEAQTKDLDKAIESYENLSSGNELSIKNYDDTLINYIGQINPKEYQRRIDVINDLNKNFGKDIKLNTPEGTLLAAQFSNFRIEPNVKDGGMSMWDANTDMVKMNYGISGYDDKLLQAIPSKSMRDYEKQMIERGAKEIQDMTIQAGKYWTQCVKDIQTMYIAQTVATAKTAADIDKLIEEGKLPKEAKIDDATMDNILNGRYMLSEKGELPKDDVTVKALMKLPLDALELGENTVGVLATSYFSNRATTDETIGVSRFDLAKQNNPQLVEPYAKNYKNVNALFQNEVKNFADEVIKKVNQNSNEKLLDAGGDYTEYGEYVMELVGQDIAKYAFLKSLGKDNLKTKILNNGEITYDYEKLKSDTTLKALGINAPSPEDEAEQLANKMRKGLETLSSNDIDYVADSISKRIQGLDRFSFRIGEALADKSGLGLDWRLDAAKDVMDMDAIRNEEDTADDGFDNVIKFWSKFVKSVKDINPYSYIVAEITDIEYLMKDTYGQNSCPYNGYTDIGQKFNGEPDFMAKFFNETGITSEAGYSYFFTNLLTSFARDFEAGQQLSPNHDGFKDRLDLLMQTRSIDYMRNLYTFMGNHDKPRLLHGLALDMNLFHNRENQRAHALESLQLLSGADSLRETPVEFILSGRDNDYMKTISTRAIAMSKLLKDTVNENLKGIASSEDIRNINQALIDLANGNYLGIGSNIDYRTNKVEELSSLQKSVEAIVNMAEKHGLKLSDTERNELVNNILANAETKYNDYLAVGDFDWSEGLSDEEKSKNEQYARDILGHSSNLAQYSLLTVQLGRLIRDSYTGENQNIKNALNNAAKDFAEKFNKEALNKQGLPAYEDSKISMAKNAYAARDIKTAMTMAIKQAEYNSKKEIANKEQIIDTVFQKATEPAVKKASMTMEFLGGLFGNAAMYSGDEMGLTGYEEKAKNIYLQNRNALPWSDVEGESLIGNYRKAVMDSMNGALANRSNPELHSLNDGTPYGLDVQAHGLNREGIQKRIAEIGKLLETEQDTTKRNELETERRELSKDLAKVAFMMQSGNGDATITVFNAAGISHDNRHDYFAEYGLNDEASRKKFFEENNIESINPDNRYVPIQKKTEMDSILLGSAIALPVGTVFLNANLRDKARYVVNEAGAIVREGGGKIILDGKTAKNGVMILKKIAFRGKQPVYNKKFNLVSNPYQKAETVDEGQKLSILAK